MAPIDQIQTQIHELQDQVLTYVKDAQVSVVDYVSQAAEAVAGRLPDERPAALVAGLAFQVDFTKQVLDTQVTFAKSIIDAATKPVLPAKPKKASAKAA